MMLVSKQMSSQTASTSVTNTNWVAIMYVLPAANLPIWTLTTTAMIRSASNVNWYEPLNQLGRVASETEGRTNYANCCRLQLALTLIGKLYLSTSPPPLHLFQKTKTKTKQNKQDIYPLTHQERDESESDCYSRCKSKETKLWCKRNSIWMENRPAVLLKFQFNNRHG